MLRITEHLRPGQLDRELAKLQQRREPPVPVEVHSLLPGAVRDAVLLGWADGPNGAGGLTGLVRGVREYAPGFGAEFLWWRPADDIRPRRGRVPRRVASGIVEYRTERWPCPVCTEDAAPGDLDPRMIGEVRWQVIRSWGQAEGKPVAFQCPNGHLSEDHVELIRWFGRREF